MAGSVPPRTEAEERGLCMLAGDIRIGKDVIIGTGDIILGPVILLFCVAYVACVVCAIVDWRNRRSDKALIQAAKGLWLADGVTLGDGFRAYFSREATWCVVDGAVDATAGSWEGTRGSLRVHLETKEIEIFTFRPELGGENRPEAMIDALIQAARAKETYPAAGKKAADKKAAAR